MRILGIDPALSISGFGVIDEKEAGFCLVDSGIIKTLYGNSLQKRLATIHKNVLNIINTNKPDCIVLEKVYVHYRHQTTAYILGQARGVICLISAQMGLPLFEYAATRIKKALVGRGLAPKEQVQRMVVGMLGLRSTPKYNDVTDALALAIAHSHIAKSNYRLTKNYKLITKN